jgi:hypothetical protein
MIDKLFNWKKHPASVFWLAGPLAALGFVLVFARAFLELSHNGDPWYLVIALGGLALLCLALLPLRHLAANRPDQHADNKGGA